MYEMAGRLSGRVVFVHAAVLTVGVRARLGLASRFDLSRSNPVDLPPVGLAHPATTFVIPHFGAGFFREALMLADLARNVYLDTSSTNSWTKYLLPRPSLSEVFGRTLDVVEPERLLFGSDSSFFPGGWNRGVFETQCKAVRSRGLHTHEAEDILGDNLTPLMSGQSG